MSCDCCGSTKLSKLGEDITETLEAIPRQWKVIQYIREKFTCRHCESISQPPAPFHVIPRGFAGPSLLAMILFEKYGVHQPLNRQSERYAKEGVDLSLSTMADLVGACTVLLRLLVDLIEAHVLNADRLHADDTPIRVLAKGHCRKATGWAYGKCMQRHRHQEFIRFLNTVPAGKVIHVILDNYAAHKHEKVRQWLARHPRWVFHFTTTSGSSLNAVETFFSALTRRRLKRGVFHSVVDLQTAINRYLDEHNQDLKPFVWTKPVEKIIEKLNQVNASLH